MIIESKNWRWTIGEVATIEANNQRGKTTYLASDVANPRGELRWARQC